MKAFITGVAGFVGHHMSRYLKSQGYVVHGSYYEDPPGLPDVILHKADILDKPSLSRALQKAAPDFVFHFAAVSSVRQSIDEPLLTKRVNVEGTQNLLEAVSGLAKAPRVLIVSSAEVYGEPQFIPITEDHPLRPLSPYAESKLEMEHICKSYNVDFVISRSFTHIGPGQAPIFFCSEFAKTIAEIEKGIKDHVLAFGDAHIVRDLTDVRDVVKAYELLLQKGRRSEVYNVCSGKGVSVGQVLEILTSLSKKPIKLNQDRTKVAKKSICTLIGSYKKLQRLTQWSPKVPVEKSLRDLLDYWRKHSGSSQKHP